MEWLKGKFSFYCDVICSFALDFFIGENEPFCLFIEMLELNGSGLMIFDKKSFLIKLLENLRLCQQISVLFQSIFYASNHFCTIESG